ncbi:GTPase domain-containing protein [Microbacter sp. GSS18]|nr:GTPase domain-containing protein [Microbacter sp. GSS18]
MPIPLLLPLIPLGLVGAGIYVGTTALIEWQKKHKNAPAPKTIAVIGRRGVGKTTLISYLRDQRLPKSVSPTQAPSEGAIVELDSSIGSETFLVTRDVPGDDVLGFPQWKEEVSSADIVCYLFRADLLVSGDENETARVKQDLLMLQGWMSKKKGKPKQYVLVGTSAQRHPDYESAPQEDFRGRVDAVPVIRLNRLTLKNARLVVGDLSEPDAAAWLREQLGERLVSTPAPTKSQQSNEMETQQ